MNNLVYEKIWRQLQGNEESWNCLLEEKKTKSLDYHAIKNYFSQHQNLMTINLVKISEDERKYLKEKQISIHTLYKNFNKAIKGDQDKINLDPRRFQLIAVRKKIIYLVCPFTRRKLATQQSFWVTPDIIFYRFKSKNSFYLITTHINTGFKKGALYFPDFNLLIKADDPQWGVLPAVIPRFQALMVAYYHEVIFYLNNCDPKKLAVCLGDDNFAHHIFNELSGLYRLEKSHLLNQIETFFVLRETLGKIENIFPQISPQKIERIAIINNTKMEKEEVYIQIFRETLKNNHFCLHVGDCYISNTLAQRIYQLAIKSENGSNLPNQIQTIKKLHYPLLWISIRVDNRTWIEQENGFANLIDALAEKFPNLGVVFDGFSYQEDTLFSRTINELQIIEKQNDIVKNIHQRLQSDVAIYNTVGCSLYESIIWANSIDFYLAHHGTIQHKVGWLANKPGIVHSNTKTLKSSHHYIENAREKGIKPIYIHPRYVQDVQLNISDPRNNLDNYQVDWQVLQQYLLEVILEIHRTKNLFNQIIFIFTRYVKDPHWFLINCKNNLKYFLKHLIRFIDFSQL
ncbi:MAG: hypothetical protein VKL42_10915 [Snowella sp.]|nr:hypothetical protein [Snowella sp.]